MKTNKTAVEWLVEQVKSPEWQDCFIWHKEEIFQQALSMERQQIMDAYNYGQQIPPFEYAEKFYNETYNK
jgi:hypothetical protein